MEHVETDLGDDALVRLIADGESDIIRGFGPHITQTDQMEELQLSTQVFLSRVADTILSVTETVGDTETVLAADDYELLFNGRVLKRLNGGTNARYTWGDFLTIQYTPVDDASRRTRILIDLCKLSIEYNAKKSEGTGDYRMTAVDYENERTKILSRLQSFPFA